MEQEPGCVEGEVEDLVAANDGGEKEEAKEVVVEEEEAPGLEGLVINWRLSVVINWRWSMVINCLGAKTPR